MTATEPYPKVLEADEPRDSKASATGPRSVRPSAEEPVRDGPPAGKWLYADEPLRHDDKAELDALGFAAYADALALVMDSKGTDTPLTVAINGPWGSGKTSLAEMAEGRLSFGSDWDSDHVICKFDAWANDDAPHLGAAFAATVAKAVNRERHWWTRLKSPIPSVMLAPEQRWRRRLWLWFLTVALAAAAVFWPTRNSLLASVLHADKTVSSAGRGATASRLALPALAVALIVLVQLVQKLGPGVQTVARWIDDPKSEAARGSMQDASQQLGKLIKQALHGKRRLMIFVDNLERCRPPRAVEVCEVVSQLIGHKDVVTVMIGDMDTIALSAEIKYAALETVSLGTPGSTGNASAGAYGRAYMEKLIQIQLRLPPPLLGGLQAMIKPPAGEPPAFPGDTTDRSLAARIREKAAVLLAPNRGTLAVGLAFTFATIATFGADTLVLVAGLVGAAISAVIQFFAEGRKDNREKEKRDAIDNAVEKILCRTETTLGRQDEVAEELERQNVNVDIEEIRRRMRLWIISKTDLRTELDNAVRKNLPLSPRGTKRMINHAHLLLDIGVGRRVFGTRPGLRPSQLAAWVSLSERWPSVAAAISVNPSLMSRLEEVSRKAIQIDTKIAAEIGITGLDLSLLDYLRRADSLAPVTRLLVNFSPLTEKP